MKVVRPPAAASPAPKKGRGRPPLPFKGHTVRVAVDVPTHTWEVMRRRAEDAEVPMSVWLRRVLLGEVGFDEMGSPLVAAGGGRP